MRAGAVETSSTKRLIEKLPLPYAVMMQQLQSVFDARAAIGNLREVVFAQRLLIGKAERAMIGRDHLQIVRAQAFPELRLVAASRAAAA